MMRSVAALLFVGITAVCAQQFFTPTPFPFAPYPSTPQYPYPYQQQYKFAPKFAPPPPPQRVQFVAAPSPAPVYAQVKSGVLDKDANVVAEYRDVNFDGTFSYGYDTENGISVKSKGYLKNPQAGEEAVQVIEGSYSFYDREGKPVSISYIADEGGYRAFGDAIPTPPEAYARAVAAAPAKK